MGSLDIGLLSINISLDEAINTCVNRLFETLTLLKVLQSRKLNKCFFGYKGVLFHIQQLTYKKNDVQQWNHLLDIPLLTHFLHKKKRTGQTLVQKQSNQIFTNVISSIFFRRYFFWRNQIITWSIFKNSYFLVISAYPFLWSRNTNIFLSLCWSYLQNRKMYNHNLSQTYV